LTVTWYVTPDSWYYVKLSGVKAHSWKDAYNRCARIKNGNAFPGLIWNETDVMLYLEQEYKKLRIDSGKTVH